jgi:hypothetical protein
MFFYIVPQRDGLHQSLRKWILRTTQRRLGSYTDWPVQPRIEMLNSTSPQYSSLSFPLLNLKILNFLLENLITKLNLLFFFILLCRTSCWLHCLYDGDKTKKIGNRCEFVEWIYLAHERLYWRDIMRVATNLWLFTWRDISLPATIIVLQVRKSVK